MKKIKYLLLGIVSLLGIGCSFAVDVNNVFGSITNSNGTKHFYSNIATSQDTIFFMGMYNNNIGNVLFPNTQSNISSYNNRMYWVLFNTMGNVVFSPGSDAKLIGSFTLNWSNPNIRYYINGSGDFGFNYLHLFYLGGSSSKYSNYYIATSTGIYSSGLTIYDIQPGYERKKIFPLVSSSFSSISSNGTDFEFSYLPFDGISSDGIYNITGIVLFHFDFYTGGYVSGNNTIILFKDNFNIYYNIFDSYSDSVLDFIDSTPISKGVLNNGYSSFVDMIQDNGYMVETYGNTSSLILRSIDSQTTNSTFTNNSSTLNTHPYNEYTFDLINNSSVSHWYDFLNGGGGSSDSEIPFIFDYNSLIINNMIICYITSGEICPYNNFSMSGFENSFPVVSSYRNGEKGQLLLSNAQSYLTELCLNSDTINYAFCSQLDIYSGAFILFDYSNGILTYNILGDSFAVDVAISNSGQLGSVGCYGSYCYSINVGDTEYIINVDTGYYTGLFLSTGYYEDFLSLNKTGFFMKCPRSYDNQNVVIGKNLLSKLGGFDIFVPINCMFAGFNAGKSFTILDWGGFDDVGPLIKYDEDYNGNKRLLFAFFDVLLSLGLIFFLMKFYHLFK